MLSVRALTPNGTGQAQCDDLEQLPQCQRRILRSLAEMCDAAFRRPIRLKISNSWQERLLPLLFQFRNLETYE